MLPSRCEQLIRLSLLAGCCAFGSCYVPSPADPATIPPGERLRVVLSSEGRERLNGVSTQQADELRGELVTLTRDSLTIATRMPGPSYANSFSDLRQTLTFGRADIREVTVPRLHRGRTAIVAGAALAAAAFLVLELLDFGDGAAGLPEGPPPGPSPLRPIR